MINPLFLINEKLSTVDPAQFAVELNAARIVDLERVFNNLDENGLRSIAGAGRDLLSKLLGSHYENMELLKKFKDLQDEFASDANKYALEELGDAVIIENDEVTEESQKHVDAKVAELEKFAIEHAYGKEIKNANVQALGGKLSAMGGMVSNIINNKSLVEYYYVLMDGFVSDFGDKA